MSSEAIIMARIKEIIKKDGNIGRFERKFTPTIREVLTECGWDYGDIDLAVKCLTEITMGPIVAVKSGV